MLVIEPVDYGQRQVTELSDLTFAHVVDAAYASWLRGCNCGPKQMCAAELGRVFLYEMMNKHIARVRLEAERNFDCAVSVSEDGKKIGHADKVLVVEQGKPTIQFLGKAFYGNKIFRDPNPDKNSKLYYLEHDPAHGEILIVHPSVCPSPLPDGGCVICLPTNWRYK